MKKLLLVLSVVVGAGLVPTLAQAQTTPSPDTTRTQQAKPQLNTAPPGTPPRPRPAPTPAPTRGYEVTTPPPAPAPAPTPADQPGAPVYRPNPNSPSGLEFPPGSRASEQPKPLRRYFVYSNFGLGFSSIYGLTQFSASIAPAIGYRITDKLAIGPGISYAYNSYSVQGAGPGIHTNSIGVKGFVQYIFYKDFFLHGEYEVTHAEVLFQDNQGYLYPGKLTVRTPLAGAGYRQHFSDRAAADIVILYNFNGDGLDDIYGQPVIRFSFLFDIGR